MSAGNNLSVAGGVTTLNSAATGNALNVNSTSNGNVALFMDNSTAVFTIVDGGSTYVNTTTDSTTAFTVQGTAANSVLTADTYNNTVKLRTLSADNDSTFDAIWLQGNKNGVTAFIGGNDSVTAYTANEFSGNLRFNGSNLAWGDIGYYPTGGGNGNYGQFRLSTAGSSVNTTPNAKLGVGDLYVANRIGVNNASPTVALDVAGDIKSSSVLLAPAVDASSAVALTVGGTNASSISLGKTTSNITTTVNGQAVFRPATGNDSTTAFQVQAAGGTDNLLTANTVNNQIKIGNNTGSGTATTQLVVDSAASDPTGTNGAMYYNTASNQFRCYQSSAWMNCINSGGVGVTAVGALDGTTKTASGAGILGTSIYMQSADASNPGLVNTGAQTFAGAKTFGGGIVNNGSTSFSTMEVSMSATGDVGTAANTVDKYTSFNVDMSGSWQTVTLPNPTSTTAGRIAYVNNVGTVSFYFYDTQIIPGASRQVIWNGSSWALTGNADDRNYVAAYTTAARSRSSSGIAADPDLNFAVKQNEEWMVTFHLQASAVSSFRAAIDAPSGSSCSYSISDSYSGNFSSATACGTLVNVATSGSGGDLVVINASLTAGADGTVALRWGSSTTTAITIRANGAMVAYRIDGADLGEVYFADQPLEPGTVVALNGTGQSQIGKTSKAYDGKVIGVVSTKPGKVIGQNDGQGAATIVGLSGRVPVKVSDENGSIEPGDYLVPSSTPGVAMKATGPGMAIGQALTDWSGKGQGSVMLFIKSTYFPGSGLAVLQDGASAAGTLLDIADINEAQIVNNSPSATTTTSTIQTTKEAASVLSGDAQTDSLTVRGNGSFAGNVEVVGAVSAASMSVKTAQVSGNMTVGGSLSVDGSISAGSLAVTGDATLQNVKVRGVAEFEGDLRMTSKVNTRQAVTKKFIASKPIKPGKVVILDDAEGKDGQVTTTTKAEDTRVIGVAVTESAQEGDEIEVAIGGWVQVLADSPPDQNGKTPDKITPGQLLVSGGRSDGSAKASDDPQPGSVLGKSTSRQDDKNLVWVLVTLQ